jgi:serine/threonine protein kinase
LQWAHERKLVHRDVKPDNILVDTAGQAKLTDLGLAKNLESDLNLTRTNCALGTPQFMAPEQFADAKRADALSDLYSLAATLYMLVTGQLPFDSRGGLTAEQVHLARSAGRTPGAPGVDPGIPRFLEHGSGDRVGSRLPGRNHGACTDRSFGAGNV